MAKTEVEREVAPGIYRLGSRYVNWWALAAEDGAVTLIDAGLPGHFEQLVRLLDTIGSSTDDVRAVLLTHADIDHIGVAERLRREAGATIYVHPDDEAAAVGEPRALPPEFAANMWRNWMQKTAAAYVRDGAFETQFPTEVRHLGDGEVLDVPGRPRVVHCPGHTPGSCAFVIEDILFSGDALVTVHALTGKPGPQLLPAFDNADDTEAVASLDVLQATGARLVLPGHGEPWTDGAADAAADARRVAQ